MQHGPAFSGILRAGKQTLPRAIAVGLSDDLHCAFDPDTLRYTLTFGKVIFWSLAPVAGGSGTGFHREGKSEVRSQRTEIRQQESILDTIGSTERSRFSMRSMGKNTSTHRSVNQDGEFQNSRTPHALADMALSGPARYADKSISLSGKVGKQIPGTPFAIDRIPVPLHNEFGSVMLIGGHDFFSNGDAAVCTMPGDVWRVSGLDADLKKVTWTRIATGLNQALGLCIHDDTIYVTGRDRITRLHDLNEDGEIDFYENFCDDFPSSPGGHDFYTGLQRDGAGYFYFVAANTGVVKVAP